jgi:rSAM/selenodomain-associated transferase 1
MVKLGIFARPPVPGQVKTRLIADLGAIKATQIYRHCLLHAIETARESGLEYQLYLTAKSDDPLFDNQRQCLQTGEDLGARMLLALQEQLKAGATGAIIIGSDCLDLRAQHLLQAAHALQTHDLVLLPALDGGFALIGCRQIQPALFDGVSWSTDQVLQQTLANAKALEYRVCLLETVRDIDRLQDLDPYPELLNLISTS